MLAILNPPTGSKIGRLSTVEAMVEASMVTVRESDHKLASFLGHLNKSRFEAATTRGRGQNWAPESFFATTKPINKGKSILPGIERHARKEPNQPFLPINAVCGSCHPRQQDSPGATTLEMGTRLSETPPNKDERVLLGQPTVLSEEHRRLTLSKGMPYFFSINGEIRVILCRRKASQL